LHILLCNAKNSKITNDILDIEIYPFTISQILGVRVLDIPLSDEE